MLEVRPKIREQKAKVWNQHSRRHSEMVMRVFPGVRIALYSDCILSRAIYMDRFEWQELKFMSEFLSPGDTFLDIGSNFGLYSLVAAKIVGSGGQVIAFEPVDKTFARLKRNIALNNFRNIEPVKLAISSADGWCQMNVSHDGHDAWNSLTLPARGESFTQEEVQTVTLDHYLLQHPFHLPIKMIKIDVEGWENEIMKGAVATLSANDAPLLQVEFSEPALQAAGSSSEKLIAQLHEFGYQLFSYNGKKDRLTPFVHKGEALDRNLFAIKDLTLVKSYLE